MVERLELFAGSNKREKMSRERGKEKVRLASV